MKVHYYVEDYGNKIRECTLTNDGWIRYIKENGELYNWKSSYYKKNLFDNEKDAVLRKNYLQMLYYKLFKYRPFMAEKVLVQHLDKLLFIQSEITKQLQDYPNFDGIDFTDVGVRGIQIRGHHKEIKGYTYGDQIIIKHDFSNYINCIQEFVEMWKEQDVPEKVKEYQRFIAAGERWGWD